MRNPGALLLPVLLVITILSPTSPGADQKKLSTAAESGDEATAEVSAGYIPQAPSLSAEAEEMLEQVKKRIINLNTAELKMLLDQHRT